MGVNFKWLEEERTGEIDYSQYADMKRVLVSPPDSLNFAPFIAWSTLVEFFHPLQVEVIPASNTTKHGAGFVPITWVKKI